MAFKKKSKYGLGSIISVGATVVIIGLLFKIQHWPYASEFITAGLGTEAILFFLLGVFPDDNNEVDWTRAYPELADEYTGDLPKVAASRTPQPSANGFSNTAALDKMLTDAKIGPELISSLGDGLRTFGDKVSSISKVGDAGEATLELTNKVKIASASYDKLTTSFEKASANLSGMANSSIESKSYHEQVTNLAKNLSALNAIYELELQDSNSHLKSMNKFYQNVSLTMQNFSESMEDSKVFKDEVGRLSKNLASLNNVYGNMLSAMNQPKAN